MKIQQQLLGVLLVGFLSHCGSSKTDKTTSSEIPHGNGSGGIVDNGNQPEESGLVTVNIIADLFADIPENTKLGSIKTMATTFSFDNQEISFRIDEKALCKGESEVNPFAVKITWCDEHHALLNAENVPTVVAWFSSRSDWVQTVLASVRHQSKLRKKGPVQPHH